MGQGARVGSSEIRGLVRDEDGGRNRDRTWWVFLLRIQISFSRWLYSLVPSGQGMHRERLLGQAVLMETSKTLTSFVRPVSP